MPALNANDAGLPEIDTRDFEVDLQPCPSELKRFRENRPAFLNLLHSLIIELKLQGQIEQLKICAPDSPDRSRAELFRKIEHPWPSRRLCLAIYRDRYMDERLLRHELGHEADRPNPEMRYDPAIEERWKNCWAFNLAANISLNARLGDGGLGRESDRPNFQELVGREHEELFEEAWTNPPRTWPDIEELAKRLLAIRQQRPC